jgi:hypothetical protein
VDGASPVLDQSCYLAEKAEHFHGRQWFMHRVQVSACRCVRGEIMESIIIIKNWLRFPYNSTFLRSHYLSPHP